MSRRIQENLVAGAILIGFLAIIVMSLDYSPRARMIPLPLATFGVMLVLFLLYWINTRSADVLQLDVLELLTGQAREKEIEREAGALAAARKPVADSAIKQWTALAMVAILLAIFVLLGPIPATFLFTAGYFTFTGYYSWKKSLAYAVAFTVFIVITFGRILEIPLDRSILLPTYGQYIGL